MIALVFALALAQAGITVREDGRPVNRDVIDLNCGDGVTCSRTGIRQATISGGSTIGRLAQVDGGTGAGATWCADGDFLTSDGGGGYHCATPAGWATSGHTHEHPNMAWCRLKPASVSMAFPNDGCPGWVAVPVANGLGTAGNTWVEEDQRYYGKRWSAVGANSIAGWIAAQDRTYFNAPMTMSVRFFLGTDAGSAISKQRLWVGFSDLASSQATVNGYTDPRAVGYDAGAGCQPAPGYCYVQESWNRDTCAIRYAPNAPGVPVPCTCQAVPPPDTVFMICAAESTTGDGGCSIIGAGVAPVAGDIWKATVTVDEGSCSGTVERIYPSPATYGPTSPTAGVIPLRGNYALPFYTLAVQDGGVAAAAYVSEMTLESP